MTGQPSGPPADDPTTRAFVDATMATVERIDATLRGLHLGIAPLPDSRPWPADTPRDDLDDA